MPQVIAMLVTIMAVFGVCWLPYQIVLLYSELRETRETVSDVYLVLINDKIYKMSQLMR